MIHPDLKPYATPIHELHHWDRNPRQGNLKAITASLQRFGQMTPIIYRTEQHAGETFKTVYVGNHRLQAAQQLGWTEIAAIAADNLTDEEIQAYAVADNRTTDLAEYDKDLYADLIANLNQQDTEILDALNYSDDEIASITSQIPEGFFNEDYPPADTPLDPVKIQCPNCQATIEI